MNQVISFDEESHRYIHTETRKPFISVTTLLKKYTKEFDSEGHAQRIANREGLTKEEVLESWKQKSAKACERGQAVHKLLELYLTKKFKVSEFQWIYECYENIIRNHIPKFKTIESEYLLFNEQYEIAGTADLIYNLNSKEFFISDFKTNEKFNFKSLYGEWFLEPLDHLQKCEFNLYALQLSLYAFLYEKTTNKKCVGLCIFHIKNKQMNYYPCNYLKSDIINLLNHWMLRNKSLN
jgi:hypothetical protein